VTGSSTARPRPRSVHAPELESWRTFLIERARRYREVGAKYVFVVAPNKESIYPEHLPPWIGPRVGPTRLDQLMAHMKSAPE
jgi:hypothetical protein